jgi:broad specificity phosphatase PhoE
MTLFYLMRHGETDWNRDHNRYCGRSDIGLSELGTRQAEHAATNLKNMRLDRVFSSGLQRAVVTAQPSAALRQLVVNQDDRLTEADFGRWEGLRRSEIIDRYPEAWKIWYDDPVTTNAGITGETAAKVYQRMDEFFREQIQLYPQDRILVVSHSTSIRIFLAGVLGMPFRNYRQLVLGNTGISVLEAAEEGMRLLQFNSRCEGFSAVEHINHVITGG